MQRRHRTVHRWMWPLLAVLALAVLVISVQVRPTYPDAASHDGGR